MDTAIQVTQWDYAVYSWSMKVIEKSGVRNDQSTVMRKGNGDLPTPLSHYCALVFPYSLSLRVGATKNFLGVLCVVMMTS